jgi:hypothetical protein
MTIWILIPRREPREITNTEPQIIVILVIEFWIRCIMAYTVDGGRE